MTTRALGLCLAACLAAPSLAAAAELRALEPPVNLADPGPAAHGDPVLLDYFSRVGERIRQAAGRRAWTTGAHAGGQVYVMFVLTRSGSVTGAAVIPEQSAASPELQELAVRIVEAAAPFPSFPPGLAQEPRRVAVPLEFLHGRPGPEVLEVVD